MAGRLPRPAPRRCSRTPASPTRSAEPGLIRSRRGVRQWPGGPRRSCEFRSAPGSSTPPWAVRSSSRSRSCRTCSSSTPLGRLGSARRSRGRRRLPSVGRRVIRVRHRHPRRRRPAARHDDSELTVEGLRVPARFVLFCRTVRELTRNSSQFADSSSFRDITARPPCAHRPRCADTAAFASSLVAQSKSSGLRSKRAVSSTIIARRTRTYSRTVPCGFSRIWRARSSATAMCSPSSTRQGQHASGPRFIGGEEPSGHRHVVGKRWRTEASQDRRRRQADPGFGHLELRGAVSNEVVAQERSTEGVSEAVAVHGGDHRLPVLAFEEGRAFVRPVRRRALVHRLLEARPEGHRRSRTRDRFRRGSRSGRRRRRRVSPERSVSASRSSSRNVLCLSRRSNAMEATPERTS